jgi:hypothetical protein
VLYLAAVLIVASVALFVAAPLGGDVLTARRAGRHAAERERLEHERALAMQGLRELEFDREMGKLSEADYAALREGLMTRALGASAALERLHVATAPASAVAGAANSAASVAETAEGGTARPRLVKVASLTVPTPAVSPAAAGVIRFCPQCRAAARAER